MRRMIAKIIICVLFVAVQLGAALAGERVALVIGNSKYAHTSKLANPANDARAIADALEDIGFEVLSGIDLGHDTMRSKLQDFLNKASKARISLLFYAGHGIQVNGQNYLIPVDAKLSSASDLNFGTVELNRVLASLDDPTRANIIILDACRNNPMARSFASKTRSASVGTGLAGYTSLGTGSLIAFATAPGKVAADGLGKNSPFTMSLIKHLRTPGLEVRQMLTRVRNEVAKLTGDKQIPWDNSSLRGDVYLTGKIEADVTIRMVDPSKEYEGEISDLQKRMKEMEERLKQPRSSGADEMAALQLQLPARTRSAKVHAVVSGGYWSHGGREGFFRTVVMAGGVEHVSHELYLQWLQIDLGTQSNKVIKTAGIPQINDASGGYVLDVKAAYPGSNSLKLTVTARSERYPQADFIITGKGDGSFAVSRAGR